MWFFENASGSPILKGSNFSILYPLLFSNLANRNVLIYYYLYLKCFIGFGLNNNVV